MGQMLKRIEPSITEEETSSVFAQFDYNQDGTITFNEFQAVLQDALVIIHSDQ